MVRCWGEAKGRPCWWSCSLLMRRHRCQAGLVRPVRLLCAFCAPWQSTPISMESCSGSAPRCRNRRRRLRRARASQWRRRQRRGTSAARARRSGCAGWARVRAAGGWGPELQALQTGTAVHLLHSRRCRPLPVPQALLLLAALSPTHHPSTPPCVLHDFCAAAIRAERCRLEGLRTAASAAAARELQALQAVGFALNSHQHLRLGTPGAPRDACRVGEVLAPWPSARACALVGACCSCRRLGAAT